MAKTTRSAAGPKRPARPAPRLNAEWHRGHRMPKNPTQAQRIAWHLAHEQHCGCREMPAGVRALLGRS